MKLIVFSTATVRVIIEEFQWRTEIPICDPNDFIIYALYAAFNEEVNEYEEETLLAVNGLDRYCALSEKQRRMLDMYIEDLLDEMERILEIVANKETVAKHRWFGDDLGIYLESG